MNLACDPSSRVLLAELKDDYQLEQLVELNVRTVLDVGAHVGGFALYALRIWPDAFVHAYEPHPANYDYLAENVKGRNVKPHRLAIVCPALGEFIRLYEGKNDTSEASTRTDIRWPHCSQNLEKWHWVPAYDARRLPPADVLKVDTEGCEVEILANYPHLAHVKALFVEPHAVGGKYEDEQARIRGLAKHAGLTELSKGIALRFVR